MIKENPKNYAPPVQIGNYWVVNELDAVTGEVLAGFGYATEEAARMAYLTLSIPRTEH